MPPGLWPTPSTMRSSTATVAAGPTGTCCARRTPEAEGPLNELIAWIAQGTPPSEDPALRAVHAFEQAKANGADALVGFIREHRMSWEMVPALMIDQREVWQG